MENSPSGINTTRLARRFGITTSTVNNKLTRAGIEPIESTTMDSGRTFKTWPLEEAVRVLSRDYSDKLAPVTMRPTEANPAPVDQLAARFNHLEGDVEQIKGLLQLLIGAVQKNTKQAA